MILGNVNANINDTWQVVHDSGELSSAVANYTISGLKGDTDLEYELIMRTVASANSSYYAQFNAVGSSQYGTQHMKGVSTTASAGRNTAESYFRITPAGVTNASGNIGLFRCRISAKGSAKTVLTSGAEGISGTTVSTVSSQGSVWNNSAEVTSLKVFGGNLGIGTRIILLKKVHTTDGMKTGIIIPNKIQGSWERIYETTLTSAATSVTISSLKGNVDILYRLIVRGIDKSTCNGSWAVFLNGAVNTSYGSQSLIGISAAVTAVRNTAVYGFDSAGGYSNNNGYLTMSDSLIYGRSGYLKPCLTTVSGDISGTTITSTRLIGSSWSNTAEITSLQVYPSADQMDAGTHIELYRLNL